jgi:hypothetical protein
VSGQLELGKEFAGGGARLGDRNNRVVPKGDLSLPAAVAVHDDVGLPAGCPDPNPEAWEFIVPKHDVSGSGERKTPHLGLGDFHAAVPTLAGNTEVTPHENREPQVGQSKSVFLNKYNKRTRLKIRQNPHP